MKGGFTYGSWAAVAGGLLGLTYGLHRLQNGHRDAATYAVTGLSVPLALGGLAEWTPGLANRVKIPSAMDLAMPMVGNAVMRQLTNTLTNSLTDATDSFQ